MYNINIMNQDLNTKPPIANSKSILKVSIVFFIIGIISLIFIEPSVPKVIEHVEGTKDCFANQHKLKNIIKEISKTERIGNILPGGDFELFEMTLVSKRYLRDYLIIPSKNCSYGFVIVNGKGTVFCKYHGTTESEKGKPIIPKYDKSKEKPFSRESYEYRRKIEMDTFNKILVFKMIREHFFGPGFIFFGFIYFALYIDALLKERKKQEKKD